MFTDMIIDFKQDKQKALQHQQAVSQIFAGKIHYGLAQELIWKLHLQKDVLILTDHRLKQEEHILEDAAWYENYALLGFGKQYSGEASYVIEDWEALTEALLKLIYARTYHQPFVIGETKRLIIREISLKDMDALYDLYDSLKDCSYIEPLYERAQEEEFTRNYIRHMYTFFNYGLWLVFRKTDGKLIGRMGIEHREIDGQTKQELGYLVHRDYQRCGYATEACKYILSYAKEELGIDTMYTCIDQENSPSIAFAKRLGFVPYADAIIDGEDSGQIFYWKQL